MEAILKQWGNSAGVMIPAEAMEISKLRISDSLEIFALDGEITFRKKAGDTFRDIAKPLINTRDWKFNREDCNER